MDLIYPGKKNMDINDGEKIVKIFGKILFRRLIGEAIEKGNNKKTRKELKEKLGYPEEIELSSNDFKWLEYAAKNSLILDKIEDEKNKDLINNLKKGKKWLNIK